MTTLYFIRHGKTEWNQEGRFQGATGNSALLPESYAQIEQLAAYLKPISFDHAFTSPILRAVETAEATLAGMGKADLPLTPMDGLKEFKMGEWEGMLFTDVSAKWPEMYDAYRHHPERFDASEVPGAQTFEQVQAQFKDAVQQAVAQYGGPDKHLLFFSHGMALTAGMGGLLGIPMADIRARGGLNNTSTSILTTDDGITFQEKVRNDISYLTTGTDKTSVV